MDIINFLMWLSLIFYVACFIPQIVTNFKIKSGKGISDLMLIGYLNAYLCLLFYIFFMNLPVSYKVMVPIATCATYVLIGQRLYYDTFSNIKRLSLIYGLNTLFFIISLPYFIHNSMAVGMFFGWSNFVFSVFNQLPQVIKMYREKSVVGFSFLFVLLFGFASIFETIAVFSAQLPLPTCVNAFRAFIMFLIFSWQFYLYRG